jgi:hypothetical protein
MAHKELVFALGMLVAASPLPATTQEPMPQEPALIPGAPPGTPETRYCMRIEAITGSRLEEVKCWTREEWAEQDVNVDMEWAKEGVRTIG